MSDNKKRSKIILDKLFGRDLSMRTVMINMFLCMATGAGIFSYIISIIFLDGVQYTFNTIAMTVTVIISMLGLYLSVAKGRSDISAIILSLAANEFLFPFLYLYLGGVNSGMPIWIVLGLVFSVFSLKISALRIIFPLNVLTYIFVMEYAGRYPVERANLSHSNIIWDYEQSLILVSIVLGAVFRVLYYRFREQNKKILEQEKELTKAFDTANSANHAKSLFLANMSHEIRNPINGILGLNTLMLRDCHEEKAIEYARNIRSASQTLLSIINDVLDISRIEAGMMEVVPVTYELFSVLNDCCSIIQPKANEKQLKFEIQVDPDLPSMLSGDESKLRQIINNLLSNAVKYTYSGSITLIVSGEAIEDNSINLTIKVKDTGIGIRQEDMEKTFDIFQRLDDVVGTEIEGSGLGLNLTRNLVKLQEGQIGVESEYGSGSTFSVTIPQKIEDASAIGNFAVKRFHYMESLSSRSSKLPVVRGSRILVVDDQNINLMVIKGLLAPTEAVVETASNGTAALSMLSRDSYDLVLLDHMMPEPNGIEVLRRLKNSEKGPNTNTPIVMLTANATRGMRDMYLAEGFSDYITKPVQEEELSRIIVKYLLSLHPITDDSLLEQESIIDESAIDYLKDRNDTSAKSTQQTDSIGAHSKDIYTAVRDSIKPDGSLREKLYQKLKPAYDYISENKRIGLIESIVSYGFVTILTVIILYLLIGLSLPYQNLLRTYTDYHTFEDNWEWVHSDGSRSNITLPVKLEVDTGETVILETVIPDDFEENYYLTLDTKKQVTDIYIDGELRLHYGGETEKNIYHIFGDYTPSAIIVLELEKGDPGSVIRWETTTGAKYSGIYGNVHYASGLGVAAMAMDNYGFEMGMAFILIIFGLIVIIIGFIIYLVHRKSSGLIYLGILSVAAASWVLTNSHGRQFVMPNIQIVSVVPYLCVMNMPIPGLMYANEVQRDRFKPVMLLNGIISLLSNVIWIVMFVSGKFVLPEMFPIVAVPIVTTVLTIIITSLIILIQEGIKDNEILLAIMVTFSIAVFCSYGYIFTPEKFDVTGSVGLFGILCIILMAFVSTYRHELNVVSSISAEADSNRKKDAFLIELSHKLRTPLNAVFGMNEMILRDSKDDKIIGYAARVRNGCSELLQIITEGFRLAGDPINAMHTDQLISENSIEHAMLLDSLDKKSSKDDNIETQAPVKAADAKLIPGLLKDIKLDFLDIGAGLSNCGDDEYLYIDILKEFVRTNRIKVIERAWEIEDYKNYQLQIHALKGSARTVGITRLSKLAADIEQAVKSGDYEYIKANHEILVEEYYFSIYRLRELGIKEQEEY